MDARAIINKLRELGMELYVENGVVHGRMLTKGAKMPQEARRLADELRMCNEDAARVLQSEAIKTVEMTPDDAWVWKARIDTGEIEIIDKIVYHENTGLATLRYREVMHG